MRAPAQSHIGTLLDAGETALWAKARSYPSSFLRRGPCPRYRSGPLREWSVRSGIERRDLRAAFAVSGKVRATALPGGGRSTRGVPAIRRPSGELGEERRDEPRSG